MVDRQTHEPNRVLAGDTLAVASFPVGDAWDRLKKWSSATFECQDKDPSPCTEKQLGEFEDQIGLTLPDDVRSSYRIYDGQCAGPGIVHGIPVEPIGDCLHRWQMWVEGYYGNSQEDRDSSDSGCTSFPNGFVRQAYFDRGWIPLTYDSGGNHIGVADYLATRDPVCPIIIHTTNTYARPGMIFVLEDAGWPVSYISPYEDVLWVRQVWADAVRQALS